MKAQKIYKNLSVKHNKGKVSLTANVGDTTLVIAKDQRPWDLAMIAIKIIYECSRANKENKDTPSLKSGVIDYLSKY